MRKLPGLRWYIITLIAIATVINYIDRNALAVMWPDISKDVGLTKDDYAAIISFFMVAYAIGQSVSGKLLDRVGTRLGFVITIFVWSVSCMMHGLGRSLATFGMFRALLGLSEAGNWPGATKANAEWFPIKERAFAQGIFNAGASVGAVISAPLVAVLYLSFGWQATFFLIGTLGIIWIVPWWFINRAEPGGHPWLTPEEKEYILSGQRVATATTSDERVLSWSELLSYKESWSVILSRFFLDPVWWLFVNWLPIYLAEVFGFDIKQIGIFAWVPYVGAAAGSLGGGWYSGYLMRNGWSAGKARKWAIALGGIISFPALIAAAYAAEPVLAVLLIAVVLFGFQVSINNIQTLPSDLFSGKSVGSLAGLGGTSAIVGVLISTWIVPAISQQGYLLVFLLAASLVPLSVASVFLLAGKAERVVIKS